MPEEPEDKAARLLASYGLERTPLYIVGTFDRDRGVSVYSQQVRALNLAWALIETNEIPARSSYEAEPSAQAKKVAIVGAGFSGLSLAAGLMRKAADAQITIFEQRDTLLPLQHGSDTRWLHPRIYDWPAEMSEASAAMLPVLNWIAARASDVVVDIHG